MLRHGSEVTNEVVELLEKNNLRQFTARLMEEGFDDLDVLAEADDEDLRDAGMGRGHIIKLRRALR